MKIDEFIKKVNKNDRMFAKKGNKSIIIYDDGGMLLMQIPNDATNWLEIYVMINNFYDCFGKPSREYLSTLIDKFLHTPVEDRFPKKKYTVQVFPVDDGYLNMDDDGYVCADDIDQICGTRTQFTQQEIDSFKQRDDIAIDWNKAKIEEVTADD